MKTDHPDNLTTALGITGGIVCAVGAGGKKSLMYALASAASGRIGMTTAVMSVRFPHRFRQHAVIGDDAHLLQHLAKPGKPGIQAYGCPSSKPGRWAGVGAQTIATIHEQGHFDLTLVKADGARMRGIKAPKTGEPVLPENPALVCPVVSIGTLAQPLNADTAHRPELLADVVQTKPGTALTPMHIARLLAAENGALQGTEGIRVVPVINQVDNDTRLAQARDAANMVLAATQRYDRVVLTSLRAEQPLVETVFRQS